jgi:O-antigen/teichoic acid export membrane protein
MSRDAKPAGGRKGRLLTGYAAAGAFLAVRVGQQLLLLPAFLYIWGADLYEQWLLLSAAAAFMALADLGTRPYFHNRLLMLRSAGDLVAYQHALRLSLGFTLASQAAAALLLVLGAAVAEQSGLLAGGGGIGPDAAATILILLGLRVLLDIPADILGNVQWAHGDVGWAISLSSAWLLFEALATASGLFLGLKPVHLALVPLAIRCGFLAHLVVLLRRRYPDDRLTPRLPTLVDLRAMLKLGLSYLSLPIGQLLSFQGLVLILGALSRGPYEVVIFSAIRTVATLLRQIIERVGGLTASELTRCFAAGQLIAFARVHSNLNRLLGGLTGLLAGAAWVYAPVFMPFLTAGEVPYVPAVLAALLAGILLGLPGAPVAWLLHQINRPGPLLLILMFQTSLMLAIAVALGARHGALGAALAVAIPEAIVGLIWLPYYGLRVLALPLLANIVRMICACAAAIALSIGIAVVTMRVIGADSLIRQALMGLAWASAVILPATWIMLGRDQRNWLYARLQRRR